MCYIIAPRRIFMPYSELGTPVPLTSLVKSAVRSRLVYEHPSAIQQYWANANERKDRTDGQTTVDAYYERELLNVQTAPIYISSPPYTGEDAQAYVWTQDDICYVTFRGTNNIRDVLANVNVRAHRYCDSNRVFLHEGFLRQFMSIEPLLTEEVRRLGSNVSGLHFAGHSLGGSLAIIASVHYGRMFPALRVSCHTFGCPRTGNAQFSDMVGKYVAEHYRVVNENDPVTMVPMRPLWYHTNHHCFIINDDGQVCIEKKDIPWWKRLFASMFHIDYTSNPTEDHNLDKYIDRLETLRKNKTTS